MSTGTLNPVWEAVCAYCAWAHIYRVASHGLVTRSMVEGFMRADGWKLESGPGGQTAWVCGECAKRLRERNERQGKGV